VPAVPTLQLSVVSIWEGEFDPVHEKPTDGYAQPCTLASSEQLVDVHLTQQ
jgi:hypothetical protein